MAQNDPLPAGWRQTPQGGRVSPQQWQYLEAGLARGLTVAATLREMRAGGLGMTERIAYDYANVYRGAQLSGSRLNRVLPSYSPNDAQYQQVIGPSKYNYRVTAQLDLSNLGIPFLGVVTAFSFSNQQLTMQQHFSNMFGQLAHLFESIKAQRGDEEFDVSPDDFTLVKAERFTRR